MLNKQKNQGRMRCLDFVGQSTDRQSTAGFLQVFSIVIITAYV